jgi:deoxyribodipyrimidine photo-lyase
LAQAAEVSVGVPALRIRACNQAPVRGDGGFVLYWMIAARRTGWSFALERAVEHAVGLDKPLVVLEGLRADYQFASERLHAFAIEGMADNARAFARHTVTYLPYVESEPGAGKGMLESLAACACVVVADDAPVFFLPGMVAAAANRLPVLLEAVDGNGLLPLAATGAVFPTAFAFRRFLQGVLPARLEDAPAPDPLVGIRLPRLTALPEEVTRRWPVASPALLEGEPAALGALPVAHGVGRVPGVRGGRRAGLASLKRFLAERLALYDEVRNQPERDGTSGLSPYLHFGHVSAHEVFAAVAQRDGWTPERLASRANGRRSGWWGMSAPAEAFLDQLVTWRELGFNFAGKRDDGDRYESLPPWARATLEKHAHDRRPTLYTPEQLEGAATHDQLWNAAQVQLLREGRIHNYLRMLWGKKVLEWSPSPTHALEVMLELNNRYALDGRDPNSTSGICWCLGRYDRPWGPERPIFGTVRYMSSENTARKVRVADYIARYTP